MVVAEAIETDAERRYVLDLGVEFGQAYLFCKPGPVDWESKVLSTASDRSDLA
jgi:EAL domain-containing protein (putative c-di-GMP-specific phosphodiesterase class I)